MMGTVVSLKARNRPRIRAFLEHLGLKQIEHIWSNFASMHTASAKAASRKMMDNITGFTKKECKGDILVMQSF